MKTEIKIREATIADAQALAVVHVTSWQSTYRGAFPDEVLDNLSVEQRAATWRQSFEKPERKDFVLVAEAAATQTAAAGQVVGFAIVGPETKGLPDYSHELYAIYLLAEYQRQGIGRRLVTAVAERLLAEGMPGMAVWVLKQNQARHFYERIGAQPISDGFVEVGGQEYATQGYGWQNIAVILGEE